MRLARQLEHPLQRDQGLLLGLRVDLDLVDDDAVASDSIAHTKCGRSIRFIVEQ